MPDRNFIKTCLKSLLVDDTSEDIIDYVLSIETEDDFTEFMQDIITDNNPEHKLIFQKLRNNLFATSIKPPNIIHNETKSVKTSQVVKKTQPKSSSKVEKPKQREVEKPPAQPKQQIIQETPSKSEPQDYDSDEINQNDIENLELIIKTAQERSIYRNDDFFKEFEAKPEVLETSFKNVEEYEKFLKETTTESKNISEYNHVADIDDETETNSEKNDEKTRKKKTKYVSLFDADNKTILQKGRHPCDCQATVHVLINNCLSCGRIVCEQEGSGPCFFCDEMVCTQEEEDILASDTTKSHILYNSLMEQKTTMEWKQAIELRNKLISIDRLGDGKNVIYDDQSDYFDLNNKWDSEEEKKRIEKRRMDFYNTLHKPISEKKTTLNISGEGVSFTSDSSYEQFEKNMLEKITKANESVNAIFKQSQFLPNILKSDAELNNINKRWSDDYMKEAQAKLLSEKDNGSCLSMHQPYASLLIAGIKKHEGRIWSTNHRGPLWIASTAKLADEFDIAECEEMYKVLYNDENLDFPKNYPSACILGCVYVEDCMPQNEYRKKYPDGESDSPFVFICSHPVALPVFIPNIGKNKIYQLDKGLHQKAKAGLKAAFKIK